MSGVLALSYQPYGPCLPERLASEQAGWAFKEAQVGEVDWDMARAEVILNVGGWSIDESILTKTGCRYVVGYGVGTNYIDTELAAELGVSVVNMPTANAQDVALHALTMILSCLRRLPESDRSVREGLFDPMPSTGLRRPSSLTLGLLAFGNIPRRLAEIARPLGFRLAAFDPFVDAQVMEDAGVTRMTTIEELMSVADVLSVHIPSTPTTRGLLDKQRLQLLPRGSVLVVTSRGEVFDAAAVAALLADGHLGFAAFDVFDPEPPDPGSALLQSDRTILSPHIAGNSAESISTMHELAAKFVRDLAAEAGGHIAGQAIGITE